MHESHLAEDVLELVLREARQRGAGKIKKAQIMMGEMLMAQPESLKLAFTGLSKGTPAEGAILEIETVSPKVYCQECQRDLSEEMPVSACPACGSLFIKSSGMELKVASLETE